MKRFLRGVLALSSTASIATGAPDGADGNAGCALCDAPKGRASLMLGGGERCPVECPELCCNGRRAVYLVEDLDTAGARQVAGALSALPDVEVEASCHKADRVVVKYNPATVQTAAIVTAIRAGGARLIGEEIRVAVAGVISHAVAAELEETVASMAGVRSVEATPGPGGGVIEVVFDPAIASGPAIRTAVGRPGLQRAPGPAEPSQ
jgi:hypothetical protein